MKNTISALCLSTLAILSCTNKTEVQQNTNETQQNPTSEQEIVNIFEVDSVSVDDSIKLDKNLTKAYQSTVLVFPKITDKPLLDSIYAKEDIKLADYSKASLQAEIQKMAKTDFEETKKSLKEYTPDFKQTWYNSSGMNVHSTQNNFMTIMYSGDGYSGGAHGYYYEFYKTFDVKNNKTLQLSDILKNQDPKVWAKILMDHFTKADAGEGQKDMLLVDQIPLNNNFYFDKENLYFLYNQYEIAAYAAGPVLIKLPFADIKTYLNPEFAKTMNL